MILCQNEAWKQVELLCIRCKGLHNNCAWIKWICISYLNSNKATKTAIVTKRCWWYNCIAIDCKYFQIIIFNQYSFCWYVWKLSRYLFVSLQFYVWVTCVRMMLMYAQTIILNIQIEGDWFQNCNVLYFHWKHDTSQARLTCSVSYIRWIKWRINVDCKNYLAVLTTFNVVAFKCLCMVFCKSVKVFINHIKQLTLTRLNNFLLKKTYIINFKTMTTLCDDI